MNFSTNFIPQRLTQNTMNEIIDHFIDTYQAVLSMRSEEEIVKINNFHNSIGLLIPAFSFRPDKLQEIHDDIFGNVLITQFILDLSFSFFSTVGNCDDVLYRLALNIKDGLTLDDGLPQYNLVPTIVADSCPSNILQEVKVSFWKSLFSKKKPEPRPPSVLTLLLNNKQLMIVYLMYLSTSIRKQTT